MQVPLERRSTGIRIHRAEDDAAGRMVRDRFQAQVNGLLEQLNERCARTTCNGISLLDGSIADTRAERQGSVQIQANAFLSCGGSPVTGVAVTGNNATTICAVSQGSCEVCLVFSGTHGTATTVTERTTLAVGLDCNYEYEDITVATRLKAQDLIGQVDDALNVVSGENLKVGPIQNSLTRTLHVQRQHMTSLTGARSTLHGADMATEAMAQSRRTVLIQSGTATVAQGQLLLQLLRQIRLP